MARNLTDDVDGFLRQPVKYLIMDRDSNFCEAFREVLETNGVEPVRLPPRSPNLNAHLERFHLSIKSECLEKMIFLGDQPFATQSILISNTTTRKETTRASHTRSSILPLRSARWLARSSAASGSAAC